MKALLVVILWCGVAAAQPARLPPPSPVFNPAQDAPHTIGQPGHLRPQPKVEPGPRPTRVLPQTPETMRQPGVWGTTAPRGSDAPMVKVEDVSIPLPPDIDKPALERAKACGAAVQEAINDNRALINFRRYLPDMRTCFVFLAWRDCMASPLWKEEVLAAGAVRHVEALLLNEGTPASCWRWVDSYTKSIGRTFEWFLKGWYYRTQRPRE